ncbi:MAG: hypothetical protein HQL80_06870 [Magnetococcales bacterium]|nr:hypothetical protein [Magnetococcales bacterium]
MILDDELFEYITDEKGRVYPALKSTVPQRVLRAMGLLTGETGGSEEDQRITQIPVKVMRGVREYCVFTADFGRVEEREHFPPPVQLVVLPCRSSTADGNCTKRDSERSCALFGASSSVETSRKERVELIVVPLFPGTSVPPSQREWLGNKRDSHLQSLRQWEDALAPVHFLMDATVRGMQFWIRSWFR